MFTVCKQGMQFHYLVFTEQDLLGRRLAVRGCGPKKPNNMVEKWEFRRVSRSHRNWHSASSCQLNDSFLYKYTVYKTSEPENCEILRILYKNKPKAEIFNGI